MTIEYVPGYMTEAAAITKSEGYFTPADPFDPANITSMRFEVVKHLTDEEWAIIVPTADVGELDGADTAAKISAAAADTAGWVPEPPE